jgi:hypothetical protein
VTTTQGYNATLRMNVHADVEEVDYWGFAVLDALMDLDGIIDADLTAALTVGEVVIDFGLHATGYEDAWLQAATAVRTALHVCGASTATMEERISEVQTTVREQSRVAVEA